ncbi:MAG: adenylate/guanylate cyclase domain-containing protein [Verrucomicrobiota bacterium]|jgi:TolB-like protein/class 3 adenylate cyclase/Flp pilus assembly protein TadD
MAPDGTEKRKLAAIMFTDMVGYTALTQRNEALALELLEEHRRVLRELFPRFNGREIKTTGDGSLLEFESAVEAVRCAIEIQRALAARNLSVTPERRVELRIGVHVGDVVHREGDVLGDGVNIAARLQPLAEPGGICVSVDVARQIQHNVEAGFVTLGPQALKNVAAPIEVCRIVLPWEKTAPAPVAPVMPRRSPWRLTKARLLTAALVVLALCGLGVWFHYFSGRPPAVTRAGASKSVAVLPFVNLSSDKENEYLSDGITEDLCTALTQVKGLRVPARTSCFFFKGKTEDIQKIGQQLHVATVLEGSVRKAGNKLRINAQLINIADGFHLWATNYDRDMSDLLALQSEIAQQVVAALRVQLLPGETQQLEKRPTVNPEAHRLYLLGRFFWNQRSGDGLKKGLNYLEQALAQDPDYALAYAGLADCYVVLPDCTAAPAKEAVPKARAAALKALELDNTLGEAHAALALAKECEWDWTAAEAEFRRAIELSPNYATAHHWYSILLHTTGRFEEARREILRAQELDPLSPIINVNVGLVPYYNRRYDEAIAECHKVLELNPNFLSAHEWLGFAYVMKGMFTEAIGEFQISRTLGGGRPFGLGGLGYAYAVSGRTGEARQVLDELLRFLQQGYEAQVDVALVYHGLGEREQTFHWLEQAFKERNIFLPYVKSDPPWQNLRSEPRFIALLKQMGLEK